MAAIIFDFDGTIADSFDYVAGFLERHVRKGRPLTHEEREKLRGMTMQQMAIHLGSPYWKLPILFIIGRRAMGRAIYDVPIFAGMGKVVEQLHAEGHELMIVSSNNNRNIKRSLKQHHLYKYFTDIYGNAGFFGKQRAIRRVLWRNSYKPQEATYIGDEVRDVVAAKAAGIQVIAASWGFDHAEILEQHKPTAVAHTPQDIVRILEEL
ncbi:MAG TPA: HAD-IA family hydrolase [Candidatus Saccharimonadales bacterium]|nr:HAD-IA family hydrolase [Candidatus Saccharimonadales bacterium]